jgi:excisionase family DNA binding protein
MTDVTRLPEVLTGDEVADLLRVSKRTVERLHLPSVKVGKLRRYLREDVLNYLRDKVA